MIRDGIVLLYVKDGTVYPVAISDEQYQMIEMLVAGICNPLPVMFDQPQGKATNLVEKLRKGGYDNDKR